MPTGLFSQIALIILSVGIIFTYITPTLDGVKVTQDTVTVYKTELEKVSAVNAKLDQVATRLNSINSDDQKKLLTYMPDSVDTIAVPRDIKAIADKNGISLTQVKYLNTEKTQAGATFVDPTALGSVAMTSYLPEAHSFTVDFEASYEQVKLFLSDLEKNAYPLEVHDLVINKTEGGFLAIELKIITYDRLVPSDPVDPSLVVPTQVTS